MQVGVLAGVQAEHMVVDSTDLPKEEEQEERTRDDIEDTVVDHLSRGGDDITALRQRPADGVGDEHEAEVAGSLDVAGAESTASREVAPWCLDEQDVPEDRSRSEDARQPEEDQVRTRYRTDP